MRLDSENGSGDLVRLLYRVPYADRQRQVNSESDRANIDVVVASEIVSAKDLYGRVHHLVASEELRDEWDRESRIIGHRAVVVAQPRPRAVLRNSAKELILEFMSVCLLELARDEE